MSPLRLSSYAAGFGIIGRIVVFAGTLFALFNDCCFVIRGRIQEVDKRVVVVAAGAFWRQDGQKRTQELNGTSRM